MTSTWFTQQTVLTLLFPNTHTGWIALTAHQNQHPHPNSNIIPPGSPRVNILNGTVVGLDLPDYGQQAFLGIPFAQPPTGHLRLRRPLPYDRAFGEDGFDATKYSSICWVKYGQLADGGVLPQDEDCLTINVVRPNYTSKDNALPIMLNIYGGGLIGGGSAIDVYNGSFLVQRSMDLNTPVIYVSFNYRTNSLGFLSSSSLVDKGLVNLGYYDQRLALHWVQTNIAAFGGDPTQVTIFGQSAGGWSVGAHLLGHGGRDDKLFRAAILQSGPPQNVIHGNTSNFDKAFATGLHAVSCDATASFSQSRIPGRDEEEEQLDCLRLLHIEEYRKAFTEAPTSAVIDNDLVRKEQSPSWSFPGGKFVKVPVILGGTTDELSTLVPSGFNSESAIVDRAINKWGFNRSTVARLLTCYPDDPYIGIPANTGAGTYPASSSLHILKILLGSWRPPSGTQDKRVFALMSDLACHAGNRFMAEQLAKHSVPIWKYRFNQIPWNLTSEVGVIHSADIGLIFV